jgi:hypothetical protein
LKYNAPVSFSPKSKSINTVQDRIRGKTQVPQQILILAGAVKRNGLRAFVTAATGCTLNTDALRLVCNGYNPAMRGQKGF